MQRNRDYRSEVTIWDSSVRALPDVPRSRNNLGKALQAAGRTDEAIGMYRKALSLDPNIGFARDQLRILTEVSD